MTLQDKIAVVTGAARSIGRAVCERYAPEGFVTDLDEANAQTVAASIGERDAALIPDLTSQGSIDAIIAAAVSRHGAGSTPPAKSVATIHTSYAPWRRRGYRAASAWRGQSA